MSFRAAIAAFLALALIGCERTSDAVLDPSADPPVLLSGSVTPSTINTDTINVGVVRSPDDQLPLSLTATADVRFPAGTANGQVTFAVTANDDNAVLFSGTLPNRRLSPDSLAGLVSVSGAIDVTIPRSLVGTLWVTIRGEDGAGQQSTQAILPVRVERLNHPPVLTNLIAPDTVVTSRVSEFLTTVQASDPDGSADIRTVVRITPSGKSFPLNDAGVNGDVNAGDGIYSETVSVNPAPSPGSYLFRYVAIDRSGDSSNVILHTIVIKP